MSLPFEQYKVGRSNVSGITLVFEELARDKKAYAYSDAEGGMFNASFDRNVTFGYLSHRGAQKAKLLLERLGVMNIVISKDSSAPGAYTVEGQLPYGSRV